MVPKLLAPTVVPIAVPLSGRATTFMKDCYTATIAIYLILYCNSNHLAHINCICFYQFLLHCFSNDALMNHNVNTRITRNGGENYRFTM